MSIITKTIPVLAIACIVVTSCTSLTPPRRPVAYLYPTLVSMSEISTFNARPTTVENVKLFLKRAAVMDILTLAGLRDLDIDILARGLSTRGYAEIDSRNSKCLVRWVSIAYDQGKTIVKCGFLELPPAPCRYDIVPDEAAITPQTSRNVYGNTLFYKTWSKSFHDGTIQLRHVSSLNGTNNPRWEVILSLDNTTA